MCIYACCDFIFMGFVALLIIKAWNYVLLRIDVKTKFNHECDLTYMKTCYCIFKRIFVAVVAML